MTNQLDTRLDRHTPAVLSVFRVVFALLYAGHGSSKLFGWPVDWTQPVGSWPFWWAGLVEFVTGVLILLGLFTRPAAFVACGEMAVAYFWQHQPYALWPFDPAQGDLGGGEPSVLYCFAFLLLVFAGGGTYALDNAMKRHQAHCDR
ncbi:MAG: DoxX family protein [Mycobacterium sp.]